MNDLAHEFYGKIKDKKETIESLTYKLSELEKPDSKCHAELTLQINRNVRSTSRYWLSKSQVLEILKNEISNNALQLAELEKKYIAVL